MADLRAFTVCILVFVCTALPAQNRKYQVSGQVTDSATGQVMPNVNISVAGSAGRGITNQSGQFFLELTRIPSVLYFSHMGYGIGSYQVLKPGERNIRITLIPEIEEIRPVTIVAEQKIAKVIRGDTLNIIDYELDGDRIVLLASPYRNQSDLRIYLTNLNGENLDDLKVERPGKQVKYPEDMDPVTEILFRDFTGQINYLDRKSVREVHHAFDRLSFGYETQYPDFIGRVFPMKGELDGKLVFQISTTTDNYTWYFGRGAIRGKMIKRVEDKAGPYRYSRPKCVRAEVFIRGNELYVFDFFKGHFEVFDREMNPVRKVPLNFQFIEVTDAIFFRSRDVDVYNFTQKVLFDEKTGKAYAFYKLRSSGRQTLREINLTTGKIDRIIPIPDYSNISNIRIDNNTVYFLYDTRVYPYYRLFFRMII